MVDKAKLWPKPKGRSLSASSDLDLYYLSLDLALLYGRINEELLAYELSERVKGLVLIKELSDSALNKLLKELVAFGWVDAELRTVGGHIDIRYFTLTDEGIRAHELYKRDRRKFLHMLIRKMHKEYTIPGWFVNRLWQINPENQGQIIIPTPEKDWNPKGRSWKNNEWDKGILSQTLSVKSRINEVAPGSFEVADGEWVNEVEFSWKRLGETDRKRYEDKKPVRNFSPRRRLALAMREAAVKLLFNTTPPRESMSEFVSNKAPLEPRSYSAWCPRLDELELIFYTDFNQAIPGRIIFPVASFRSNGEKGKYQEIKAVRNLNNEFLCLHKPEWNEIRPTFEHVLFNETQRIFKRTKALYVSVQDVRDEVCRQLRISSAVFNDYLSKATLESLERDSRLRISLETDIREDQRSYYQQRRRAVVINNKLISLIAITKPESV